MYVCIYNLYVVNLDIVDFFQKIVLQKYNIRPGRRIRSILYFRV